MRVVRKAVGYITCGCRVLFFRATEAPDVGAELPGGTLEPREEPEVGLMREVFEETGLQDFEAPKLLGVVEFDPADSSGETHRRHFYHLPFTGDAPERWSRVVEEGSGRFTFNFFWVGASEVPVDVYPGHDAFLAEVFERLKDG